MMGTSICATHTLKSTGFLSLCIIFTPTLCSPCSLPPHRDLINYVLSVLKIKVPLEAHRLYLELHSYVCTWIWFVASRVFISGEIWISIQDANYIALACSNKTQEIW